MLFDKFLSGVMMMML